MSTVVQSGPSRKSEARVQALRTWERLTSCGLDQWDPVKKWGLPPYDTSGGTLRGGVGKYLERCADGTWKDFFIRWVVPELDKQRKRAEALFTAAEDLLTNAAAAEASADVAPPSRA